MMEFLLYNKFNVQGHLFRVDLSGNLLYYENDLVRYLTFKVVPAVNYYSIDPIGNGYIDISQTESGLSILYNSGIEIKIS